MGKANNFFIFKNLLSTVKCFIFISKVYKLLYENSAWHSAMQLCRGLAVNLNSAWTFSSSHFSWVVEKKISYQLYKNCSLITALMHLSFS